MEDKKVKKFYSYCSIGRKEEISGTIEGIVLPMKTDTYIRKDGSPAERMTFGLSCKNVSQKIEAALGVVPVSSKTSADTTFVNCTVFGKNIERIRQFVHEQDVVIVSGAFTTYPTNNGSEHRINLRVSDIKVLKYHMKSENSEVENQINRYDDSSDYNEFDCLDF